MKYFTDEMIENIINSFPYIAIDIPEWYWADVRKGLRDVVDRYAEKIVEENT